MWEGGNAPSCFLTCHLHVIYMSSLITGKTAGKPCYRDSLQNALGAFPQTIKKLHFNKVYIPEERKMKET